MNDLYICNGLSNYISKINLTDSIHQKIHLEDENKIIGIHGIDFLDDKIYIAGNNSYNFYEININTWGIKSWEIGMFTNDLKIIDDFIYLICSDTNCLVVYDMTNKCLCYQIECGNYPQSMEINNKYEVICVTSSKSDQINMIDYKINDVIKNIRTGNFPMNSKFYKDSKYIFVCESNFGDEINGTFSIYDFDTGQNYKSIKLNTPVDMYIDYESKSVFVSNYLGNCVSIIDLLELREISRIYVNGNPRGIYKNGRFLYVVLGDKELLIKYDLYTRKKETIRIGEDPSRIYGY